MGLRAYGRVPACLRGAARRASAARHQVAAGSGGLGSQGRSQPAWGGGGQPLLAFTILHGGGVDQGRQVDHVILQIAQQETMNGTRVGAGWGGVDCVVEECNQC